MTWFIYSKFHRLDELRMLNCEVWFSMLRSKQGRWFAAVSLVRISECCSWLADQCRDGRGQEIVIHHEHWLCADPIFLFSCQFLRNWNNDFIIKTFEPTIIAMNYLCKMPDVFGVPLWDLSFCSNLSTNL